MIPEAERYLSVLFHRGNVRHVFTTTSTRREINPDKEKRMNPSTAIPVINKSVPPINMVIVVITIGDALRDLFRYLPVRDAIICAEKQAVAAI